MPFRRWLVLVVLLSISLVTYWGVLVLFIVLSGVRSIILAPRSPGILLQLIEPLIAWRLLRQRWYKLGLCFYSVRAVWAGGLMIGFSMAGAGVRGVIIAGSLITLLALSITFFLWWHQDYFDD